MPARKTNPKGLESLLSGGGGPYLRVKDFSSKGRASRVPHARGLRHLFSDLETRMANELEWSSAVSSFREQYPLPLHETQRIAEELGIRHPVHPKTSDPAVMTTDFVYEIGTRRRRTRHARSVKWLSELDLRPHKSARKVARTSEKLEIERRYWEHTGIGWRLVTEEELDRTRSSNIGLFLSHKGLDPHEGEAFWEEALTYTSACLRSGSDRPIAYLAKKAEADGKLLERHFVACVKLMCAARVLRFDMTKAFSPELRACDFSFAGDAA